MTLVLIWASWDLVSQFHIGVSPGPSEYAPSGPHLDMVILIPTSALPGHGSTACPAGVPPLDLMTLVLPWHHRDMVTLFPTGTELILVTQVLTLASSVPGDSCSNWASPVTGYCDPKHGLT